MSISPPNAFPLVSILPELGSLKLTDDQQLSLIEMLVKITEETFFFYEKGLFKELDALIGNNGCETHAFNVLSLAHSEELKEECTKMVKTCERIKRCVSKEKKKINEQMKEITLSKEMLYLIQSRLLTITKIEVMDGEDKTKSISLQSKMNVSAIKLFKPEKLSGTLKKIVETAQSRMSELSIALMTAKLETLRGNDGIIKRMIGKEENLYRHSSKKDVPSKLYSCSYYNTKALLLLAIELKTPLLIKAIPEKGQNEQIYIFKPTEEFGKFEVIDELEVGAVVIVCVAKLQEDDGWLKQKDMFLDFVLADAATQASQFIPSHPEMKVKDDEAQDEIQKAKVNNPPFHFLHFYCETWGGIKP